MHYLIKFEFKPKDMTEGLRFTHIHVRLYQWYKEIIILRPALIHLQDNIQNSVGIQVKTSYGEENKVQFISATSHFL